MGIATYPAASAGGIKSVQRGSAGGAGNVTITAVDISKSFVTVYGTASSGTVAASFGLNSTSTTLIGSQVAHQSGSTLYRPSGSNTIGGSSSGFNPTDVGGWTYGTNINAATVNAGSNNLVAAVVQGYLSNSTTLVVSGACRWEVVEFN